MRTDAQAVPDSDEQLIARLSAGEESVLNILMERYQHPLYHFVLRYTHDEQQAYDIVQETFVKVYTRADSFNQSYRFKTWLYQISLNLCRDLSRKNSIRRLFSFDEAEKKQALFTGDDAGLEIESDKKEEIARLQSYIAELPHKLKSALILFSLEEKSQIEAAKILGVSPKTVETRVYRAKKLLKKKMTA